MERPDSITLEPQEVTEDTAFRPFQNLGKLPEVALPDEDITRVIEAPVKYRGFLGKLLLSADTSRDFSHRGYTTPLGEVSFIEKHLDDISTITEAPFLIMAEFEISSMEDYSKLEHMEVELGFRNQTFYLANTVLYYENELDEIVRDLKKNGTAALELDTVLNQDREKNAVLLPWNLSALRSIRAKIIIP